MRQGVGAAGARVVPLVSAAARATADVPGVAVPADRDAHRSRRRVGRPRSGHRRTRSVAGLTTVGFPAPPARADGPERDGDEGSAEAAARLPAAARVVSSLPPSRLAFLIAGSASGTQRVLRGDPR